MSSLVFLSQCREHCSGLTAEDPWRQSIYGRCLCRDAKYEKSGFSWFVELGIKRRELALFQTFSAEIHSLVSCGQRWVLEKEPRK